jgi:flavin reductase (DIM6/NTAB) family NADH-FMN oxidoreductase RutF
MSASIAALFQRLTQGVYVVGVAHGEVRNAFTAAWVMQLSFDPLLLALSIDPHHSSYGLLRDGRRAFSVVGRPLRWAGRPRQQIGFDGVDDGPHRGTLAA